MDPMENDLNMTIDLQSELKNRMIIYYMVPQIAINTIIFTGGIAVLGIVDFVRILNGYKKKGCT